MNVYVSKKGKKRLAEKEGKKWREKHERQARLGQRQRKKWTFFPLNCKNKRTLHKSGANIFFHFFWKKIEKFFAKKIEKFSKKIKKIFPKRLKKFFQKKLKKVEFFQKNVDFHPVRSTFMYTGDTLGCMVDGALKFRREDSAYLFGFLFEGKAGVLRGMVVFREDFLRGCGGHDVWPMPRNWLVAGDLRLLHRAGWSGRRAGPGPWNCWLLESKREKKSTFVRNKTLIL